MELNAAKLELQALKEIVSRRLKAIDTDLSQPLGADAEDRALQVENDEVLKCMTIEGRKDLQAIKAALDRVANGTYGQCVQCEGSIQKQRLLAIPYTSYCISCSTLNS